MVRFCQKFENFLLLPLVNILLIFILILHVNLASSISSSLFVYAALCRFPFYRLGLSFLNLFVFFFFFFFLIFISSFFVFFFIFLFFFFLPFVLSIPIILFSTSFFAPHKSLVSRWDSFTFFNCHYFPIE